MCKKQYRRSGGFTIAEVLLAMTILAMLMTAVTVAFSASMNSYDQNVAIFRATNTARQVLLRITTELRTANAVALGDASTQCSMVTADGKDITYSFNSDQGILYLITNDDLADADYIMCKDVTAVNFVKTADPSNPGTVRNVQLIITVEIDGVIKTTAAAAVIRRNMS